MSTNGTTVFKEQSRHVLRNNTSRCLRRTIVRITSDVTWHSRTAGQPDSRTAGITNKVLEAGVQTSYVHSSIKINIDVDITINNNNIVDANVNVDEFTTLRAN